IDSCTYLSIADNVVWLWVFFLNPARRNISMVAVSRLPFEIPIFSFITASRIPLPYHTRALPIPPSVPPQDGGKSSSGNRHGRRPARALPREPVRRPDRNRSKYPSPPADDPRSRLSTTACTASDCRMWRSPSPPSYEKPPGSS